MVVLEMNVEELLPTLPLQNSPPSSIASSSPGSPLANLGNTCFLNSVLQCLAHTPMLLNFVGSEESHTRYLQRHAQASDAFQVFETNLLRMRKGDSVVLRPHPFVNQLSKVLRGHVHGQQQDAHEYLVNLLQFIQNVAIEAHKKVLNISSEYMKKRPFLQLTTAISQIFGCKLRSRVCCSSCNRNSDTFDPAMDLSLEITNCHTLHDCLARFTGEETLGSSDAYSCSFCKKKTRATKQLQVHTLPNVLILHFKRFDSLQGFRAGVGKICRPISFPEVLNMTRYLTRERCGKNSSFTLHACLVHKGQSMHSGHYFAFVKAGHVWYKMDDSVKTMVSSDEVLRQEAYILFYSRNSPRQESLHKDDEQKPTNMPSPHPPRTSLTLPVPRLALSPPAASPNGGNTHRVIGPMLPPNLNGDSASSPKIPHTDCQDANGVAPNRREIGPQLPGELASCVLRENGSSSLSLENGSSSLSRIEANGSGELVGTAANRDLCKMSWKNTHKRSVDQPPAARCAVMSNSADATHGEAHRKPDDGSIGVEVGVAHRLGDDKRPTSSTKVIDAARVQEVEHGIRNDVDNDKRDVANSRDVERGGATRGNPKTGEHSPRSKRPPDNSVRNGNTDTSDAQQLVGCKRKAGDRGDNVDGICADLRMPEEFRRAMLSGGMQCEKVELLWVSLRRQIVERLVDSRWCDRAFEMRECAGHATDQQEVLRKLQAEVPKEVKAYMFSRLARALTHDD